MMAQLDIANPMPQSVMPTPPKPSPMGKPCPVQYHMDDERDGTIVHFQFDEDFKGYFVVNTYADGALGELSIFVSKAGSFERGMTTAWATAISMLLQYGVDPRDIYAKFKYLQFEPAGIAGVRSVPIAKSLIDLIMNYMEKNYPPTGAKQVGGDEYDEIVEVVGQ